MKLPHYAEQAVSWFQGWMSQPLEEMNRWGRSGRYLVEVGRHVYSEMMADRAFEMAAALTYRTIFGLIPFFVLALLVFRAFGGFQSLGPEMQNNIYGFFNLSMTIEEKQDAPDASRGEEVFSTPQVQEKTPPESGESAAPDEQGNAAEDAAASGSTAAPGTQAGAGPGTTPRGTQETRAGPTAGNQASGGGDQIHKADLQQILADLNERVAEVDFKSIGVVGLVLLIWAAISLVVTVEQCFNRVYQCSSGRSWLARITIYWAVITLGPVLVALSIWLTSSVMDAIKNFAQTGLGQGVAAVDGPRTVPSGVLAYLFGVLLWLLQAVTWLAALFVSVLLMFLLYMMMPNARVRLKPALIGGVVAALLWELAKFGFRIYVDKAVAISALYGSLGLIPLFLLWLYLTWMIILFGLELTYTLQAMPQGRFQRLRESRDAATDTDPVWLVSLLVIIGRAFARGEASDEGEIAGELGLPLAKVQALCRRLHGAKLLNQLECDDRSLSGCEWALAAPPDQIVLNRVLKVGDELTNNRRDHRALPAGRIVEQMRQAQRDSVGKQTLAQVIAARDEAVDEPEDPSLPAGATPERG